MGDKQVAIEDVRRALSSCKPSAFVHYRDFLESLYRSVRQKGYSYSHFSEHLGLGFGNVSWLLIKGKRRITTQSAQKIIQNLGLENLEKKYFQSLVAYNNANQPQKRDEALKKMMKFRSNISSQSSEKKVLDFYSHWLHAVVFEMIGLKDFQYDFDWMMVRLHSKVTRKELQSSFELLESLELIQRDAEKNTCIKLVEDFESPVIVPGVGVMNFHRKMIELGLDALETMPCESRHISAVTLAVSREGKQVIQYEIDKFRNYLMFLASQYPEKEEILEVNIQAFELTKEQQ